MKYYCTVPHCPFPASHKQENLADSALLNKKPGTFNYYCHQHAPIFIDLYEASKELKKTKPPSGRHAEPFGPVVKLT